MYEIKREFICTKPVRKRGVRVPASGAKAAGSAVTKVVTDCSGGPCFSGLRFLQFPCLSSHRHRAHFNPQLLALRAWRRMTVS